MENYKTRFILKNLKVFSYQNIDYVCKLKNALYGLNQSPRAWFSRLDNYLKQQGFKRGATESNLYLKIEDENMIIVVVYVYEIIFGINLQILSVNFASKMKKEFEMSMLGELTFSWDYKSISLTEESSFLKPSTSNICLKTLRWKNPSL